jgi:hypothetical protein
VCWSQPGYFSGIYCMSRICLEFPTLGPQAAFCRLKSVTDLQRGFARFPVIVTTFCRGVRKNSVTNLFFCSWLVFLTTCEPSTAKLPWLHKPLGVYNSLPDTDQGSGLWEFICPESASIIKFLLPAKWFGDFVSLAVSRNKCISWIIWYLHF